MKTTNTKLGSYQIPKRLAVWQATHKKLWSDDTQYRKRCQSYLAAIICLVCLLLPFYLPFFGIRLFGWKVDLSIILCLAAMIVYLASRQFHFMNHNVRRYLQSSHAA